MTATDYLIDSALVLLVLLQVKERPLTTEALIRPLVIVAIAVVNYLHGIPTAGNDLVLVGVLAVLGLSIRRRQRADRFHAARPRRRGSGSRRVAVRVLLAARHGSRFAFLVWISHGGAAAIGQFSAQHAITGGKAWTAALLAMAVFEVGGRSLVLAARRRQDERAVPAAELA